jgi:hypothetical protein
MGIDMGMGMGTQCRALVPIAQHWKLHLSSSLVPHLKIIIKKIKKIKKNHGD